MIKSFNARNIAQMREESMDDFWWLWNYSFDLFIKITEEMSKIMGRDMKDNDSLKFFTFHTRGQ